MGQLFRELRIGRPERPPGKADAVVLLAVAVLLYLGVGLAFAAPDVVHGPDISRAPAALPWYAMLSVGRMPAAYALSLTFTLVYGRVAAYNRRAEQVLMPLLDVLQSVPILSFLPAVLIGFSAIVAEPVRFGGRDVFTVGIGAIVARATAAGDYPLLLAATLSMILAVVLINRLIRLGPLRHPTRLRRHRDDLP